MLSQESEKRRKFLINPRFQYIFLMFMMTSSSFIVAMIYFAHSYFFWKFKKIGESLNLPANHYFFIFLNQQKISMFLVFGGVAITVFLLQAVLGLIFSHRIAGPIHRFEEHLLSTRKTKTYKEISFRKRDFFPELAEAYNAHLPSKVSNK